MSTAPTDPDIRLEGIPIGVAPIGPSRPAHTNMNG
jgi:hypothetical protein